MNIFKRLKDHLSDKKIREDAIGGVTLAVGAGFYGLNIWEAFVQGNIIGVSLLWSLFFVLLNLVYCRIFYSNGLPYSFYGSSALAVVESIYTMQIFYYG